MFMLLLLFLLTLVSAPSVTVSPSITSRTVSWPENGRVDVTVKCDNYGFKVRLRSDRDTGMSAVLLKSSHMIVEVYCHNAGDKSWYNGAGWTTEVDSLRDCSSGTHTTYTVEMTTEKVTVRRQTEVLLTQIWTDTDGDCLLQPHCWKLQNWGTTTVTATSLDGILLYF